MHVNIDFKAKEIELLDESFKASDLLELLDNALFKSFTVKAVVNINCNCQKSPSWFPYDITVNPIHCGTYVKSSANDTRVHTTFTSPIIDELLKEIKKDIDKE